MPPWGRHSSSPLPLELARQALHGAPHSGGAQREAEARTAEVDRCQRTPASAIVEASEARTLCGTGLRDKQRRLLGTPGNEAATPDSPARIAAFMFEESGLAKGILATVQRKPDSLEVRCDAIAAHSPTRPITVPFVIPDHSLATPYSPLPLPDHSLTTP